FHGFLPPSSARFSPKRLQETYAATKNCPLIQNHKEYLRLHRRGLHAWPPYAEGFGIHAPKCEPFPLFFPRRKTIRIQDVTFIKDRIDDLLQPFLVHAGTSSFLPASINRSTVASQSANPCNLRYSYRRSNTSFLKWIHAEFG